MDLSFQACRYGHVQHLEHLLFYGADMSAQNASGNTALHVCALYNQVTVVYKCIVACVLGEWKLVNHLWIYIHIELLYIADNRVTNWRLRR